VFALAAGNGRDEIRGGVVSVGFAVQLPQRSLRRDQPDEPVLHDGYRQSAVSQSDAGSSAFDR